MLLLSLLLLISLALLITVFYHFYKTPDYKPVVELTSKDKIVITSGTRDSLQQAYTATVSQLDEHLHSAWTDADSLNDDLEIKISEFYRLRRDIAAILKDRSPDADLGLAKSKINELQQKVSSLSFINKDVQKENQRLSSILNQLKRSVNEEEETNPVTERGARATASISSVETAQEQVRKAGLSAAGLGLTAVKDAGDKDEETSLAQDAEKLEGSFVLNSNSNLKNEDIMIVVTQPDGKVLQPSAWEAGMFETASGRKIYSRKITFDAKKGENKKLQFSMSSDVFQKGNYLLQVYHDGVLLGKAIKIML